MLISSPLERAKRTAEIISKTTKHEIHYSDLFVERGKPTELYGRSKYDEEANKLYYKEWTDSLYNNGPRAKDGENYDELINRIDNAISYLQDLPQKSIVVVTHSFFYKNIFNKVNFR